MYHGIHWWSGILGARRGVGNTDGSVSVSGDGFVNFLVSYEL